MQQFSSQRQVHFSQGQSSNLAKSYQACDGPQILTYIFAHATKQRTKSMVSLQVWGPSHAWLWNASLKAILMEPGDAVKIDEPDPKRVIFFNLGLILSNDRKLEDIFNTLIMLK